MKIFNMTQEEFDSWINSPEGIDFLDKLTEHIEKQLEEDEFFCAKECWRWECEYNSHYCQSNDVPMGSYTVCHKFKNNEKNTCDKRETWLHEKDE